MLVVFDCISVDKDRKIFYRLLFIFRNNVSMNAFEEKSLIYKYYR